MSVPSHQATSSQRLDRRSQWIDLWRQWPWIYPRGIASSAEAWVTHAQDRLGWYAGSRADWREVIHPAGVTVCEPPADLAPASRPVYRQVASRRHPAAAVCYLSGAHVFSNEGLVLTRDNRVLADYHHQFGIESLRRHLLRHPFRLCHPRVRRIEESVGLLAAPQGWNHYHWIFDVLPRVHLLSRWRPVIERYLVPVNLTSVQVESLRLLGIDDAQLLRIGPTERFRCQHLYAPSLPGSEGCSPPWVLKFLRQAFTASTQATTGKGPRIYIRRGTAGGRPVLNELELVGALERRGFTCIALESCSFAEQVAIFRDAEIVVGAHGAGLANLAFSQRGAVIELISSDYPRADCYFPLARQAGLAYECWIDPIRCDGRRPWGGIEVDVAAVGQKLDRCEQALTRGARRSET